MQAIFYTDISKLPSGAEEDLLPQLSTIAKQGILTHPPGAARLLRICGKLLTLQVLQHLGSQSAYENIRYNELGKLYLPGGPAFNIAHSGNIVICAGTTAGAIGIDIEQTKKIDTTLFDEYLTPAEQELACNSPDAQDTFYKLWVRKEAIVKAIGKGIFQPLHELEVTGNAIVVDDRTFYYTELHIGAEYRCCIASEGGEIDVLPEEVTL